MDEEVVRSGRIREAIKYKWEHKCRYHIAQHCSSTSGTNVPEQKISHSYPARTIRGSWCKVFNFYGFISSPLSINQSQ